MGLQRLGKPADRAPRPEDEIEYEESPAAPTRPLDDEVEYKLWLGFPRDVTRDELSDLIRDTKVIGLDFPCDSDGTSRGFAFANYYNDDDRRAAMSALADRRAGTGILRVGLRTPRLQREERAKREERAWKFCPHCGEKL